MTKEELTQMCLQVINNDATEVAGRIDKLFKSGAINPDKLPTDYKAAYAVLAILYERWANGCIYGAASEETRKEMKKLKKHFSHFI